MLHFFVPVDILVPKAVGSKVYLNFDVNMGPTCRIAVRVVNFGACLARMGPTSHTIYGTRYPRACLVPTRILSRWEDGRKKFGRNGYLCVMGVGMVVIIAGLNRRKKVVGEKCDLLILPGICSYCCMQV